MECTWLCYKSHTVWSVRFAEQRCMMWVNPGKEHRVWQAHPNTKQHLCWLPNASLLPQLPLALAIISGTGFISWHHHSIFLLHDLADTVFLLLIHVQNKNTTLIRFGHPTFSNQMGFYFQNPFSSSRVPPFKQFVWILKSSVFYQEPWVCVGVNLLVLIDTA